MMSLMVCLFQGDIYTYTHTRIYIYIHIRVHIHTHYTLHKTLGHYGLEWTAKGKAGSTFQLVKTFTLRQKYGGTLLGNYYNIRPLSHF